eukprot:Gb_35666 [translate_table: standard]
MRSMLATLANGWDVSPSPSTWTFGHFKHKHELKRRCGARAPPSRFNLAGYEADADFIEMQSNDVVDPHGDNENYRRRHTLAMMRRLGSENVKIYSEICTSKLQEGAGMDEDVSDSIQVSGTHGKYV